MPKIFIAAATVLLLGGCAPEPEPGTWDRFDAEEAMATTRHLAEEIGPRPTGSPGEAAALRYLRRRGEAVGLAFEEMPVEAVPSWSAPGRVRIDSRQLVARIPGTDPAAGSVLLAAHLDSRDPACPGANDDASAVGVLLEAGRILRDEPLPADVILLLTTAEELGLLGARAYVEDRGVQDLRFALTLDPVGYGELFIAPFPTSSPPWANRMLERAARRVGSRRTTFDAAYLLVPRVLNVGFGADHEPFQRAEVPAFNLSNRLRRWNYHTPQDTMEWIEPAALEEAGRLALALLDDAARSPVSPKTDPLVMVQPLGVGARLWLPGWFLVVLAAAGVLAGGLAGWRGLRHGWSRAVGVAALWGVVCFLALVPEKLLEAWHGWRYPWWNAPGRSVLLAVLAGLLAWSALARAGRAVGLDGPNRRESRALLAAAALLCAFAAALLSIFGRPDAALYASWPALLWGAMALAPAWLRARAGAWLHVPVVLLGVAPLASFARPVFYRQVLELLGYDLWIPAGAMGVAFWLVLLPAALALAATPGDRRFLAGSKLQLPLLLAVVVLLGGLATVPPYGPGHPRTILLHQSFTEPDAPIELRVRSFERLRQARLGARALDTRATRLDLEGPVATPMIAELASTELGPGRLRVEIRLETTAPASKMWVRFSGDEPIEVDGLGAGEPEETALFALTGRRRLLELDAEIRGAPGSSVTITPGATWDVDFLGWERSGDAVVWDMTGSTQPGYAQQTLQLPR